MTTRCTTGPSLADTHDRIRVVGARENNLKNISIALSKRRLTAFTGVSGSGKSSLVFDTIAAESRRMFNETYSAFIQGFMPTQARPDVDVLDGLATAIIVDQEPMGPTPARPSEPRPTPAPRYGSCSVVAGRRTWVPRRRSRSTSPPSAVPGPSPSNGAARRSRNAATSPSSTACARTARAPAGSATST